MTDQPRAARNAAIDKERLRRKYLEERDKRLRADGNDQYLRLEGPARPLPRRPLHPGHAARAEDRSRHLRLHRRRLRRARHRRAAGPKPASPTSRIIEKGGDFGGTWYWNRYPGAQCDTASMVYMPLLEETGHMPTEKYAHAPEILAHCQRIGRQYGLYDNALFHTEVTELEWDDAKSRWIIRTNRGDALHRAVRRHGHRAAARAEAAGHPRHRDRSRATRSTPAAGTTTTPAAIPAARRWTSWPTSASAIIGTGATSVQCVPHLARACKELYVFQRTPSSVDVRANAPIDPDWFAEIATPGWQQRWLENFTANQAGGNADEDLVQDGWTDICRGASAPGSGRCRASSARRAKHAGGVRGLRLREDGGDPRAGRHRSSSDRETAGEAEGLVPPALQAAVLPRRVPAGVQHARHAPGRHRRQGRRADHRERRRRREAWSTRSTASSTRPGFEVGTDYTRPCRLRADRARRRHSCRSSGREGMRTKHGIHVHGFPNAFFVQPTQGANLDLQRPAQPDRGGARPSR